MKKSTLVGVGAVFLIALILGSLYYFSPSSFSGLLGATTISISQISVDPQGAPVGDEWQGSFWNVLAYVNANDNLAGVVLPEGQTGSITFQGAVAALKTGAKVEVKIDPGTPYLIRDIQEKMVLVAPGAVGSGSQGGQSQSSLVLSYYDWSGEWRIYTPFTVSILKDGQLVGQPMTLNMQGEDQVQSVNTAEGAVRVENLGVLMGNYLSPNFPSQIAIFKGAPNVYDWAQIQSRIDGSTIGSGTKFADYWYGTSRNSGNQAINPVVMIGTSTTNLYSPNSFGGWEGSAFGGNVQAVKPVIVSGDKSSLPSDKRTYMSVTEWLQGENVANLASGMFNTRATGDSGALWQAASFVTDTNGMTALRLDIPWGAFGTPLVSIRIPTELADTFVEQPIITATSVSSVWETTGNTNGNIMGSSRIACTVTNTGSITGSSHLTVESGNSKLSVTPLEMTVNNLEPNMPQTVYFDATNLGVQDQMNDVPVTIIAHDTYTGAETGRTTLYGTLLATLQTGTTTLAVGVVEKGTDIPVVGLQLTVQYGSQAPTPFTNANGEVWLNLETPQGGAYTGQVFVESADTPDYKPAYETYTLNNPALYSYTFEVERKDTDYGAPFNWSLVLLIAGVIAAVCVVGGVGYVASKRLKHTTRTRTRRR